MVHATCVNQRLHICTTYSLVKKTVSWSEGTNQDKWMVHWPGRIRISGQKAKTGIQVNEKTESLQGDSSAERAAERSKRVSEMFSRKQRAKEGSDHEVWPEKGCLLSV